jgi:hypothetical protein
MRANGLAAMGAVLALGIIGGVISTIMTTEQLQGVLVSWLLPGLWH